YCHIIIITKIKCNSCPHYTVSLTAVYNYLKVNQQFSQWLVLGIHSRIYVCSFHSLCPCRCSACLMSSSELFFLTFTTFVSLLLTCLSRSLTVSRTIRLLVSLWW